MADENGFREQVLVELKLNRKDHAEIKALLVGDNGKGLCEKARDGEKRLDAIEASHQEEESSRQRRSKERRALYIALGVAILVILGKAIFG